MSRLSHYTEPRSYWHFKLKHKVISWRKRMDCVLNADKTVNWYRKRFYLRFSLFSWIIKLSESVISKILFCKILQTFFFLNYTHVCTSKFPRTLIITVAYAERNRTYLIKSFNDCFTYDLRCWKEQKNHSKYWFSAMSCWEKMYFILALGRRGTTIVSNQCFEKCLLHVWHDMSVAYWKYSTFTVVHHTILCEHKRFWVSGGGGDGG